MAEHHPGDNVEKKRNIAEEARGLGKLLVEATKDATTVVEDMHQTIAGGPAILGRPFLPIVKLCTGGVYGTIRGITGLVGVGLDSALERFEPLVSDLTPNDEYDIVRAALNGVIGDYLKDQHNPLAMDMQLRSKKGALSLTPADIKRELPDATGDIVMFLHGSSMDDTLLTRRGHNHAQSLAQDLGFTPIYVRFNSGLHISTNGNRLAPMLQELVASWPVPVKSIVFLGFSMGGLVARSAVHFAEENQLSWRAHLSAMVFMGTPHHGAPLERWGNTFETLLGLSRYSAPLKKVARLRSAGVTDLRYGNFLDEHWEGRDRFEFGSDPRMFCGLPAVPCFAIAGTTDEVATEDGSSDGLVPIESALGNHESIACDLGIPKDHQLVVAKTGHLDLLGSPEVYEQIRTWLAAL
jgi:pimeloyl-ACP methyl ester carboxylesterase